MNAMAPVPADHPLMVAWKAYQETEDFKNAFYWATTDKRMRQERAEEHGVPPDANVATEEMKQERAKGSLWASFMAGFNAALELTSEQMTAPQETQMNLSREKIAPPFAGCP